MAPPYPARHVIMHAVLECLRKNYRLHHIEALPGMPSRQTLYRWARAWPDFRRQMAEARFYGRFSMRAALYPDGGFDAARAEAFLARVRLGDPIRELVKRPEGPHREMVDRW